KGCLYGRSLGSNNHYFIIMIIKCRPDTSRIPHYKSIAMTKYTADGIPPVPGLSRPAKNRSHINMLCDLVTDLFIRETIRLILVKKLLIFRIEKVPYFFKNGYGIRSFLGVLPQFKKLFQQFINI